MTKKQTKKIKILAIGDIHGDTGLVKKLAKRARDENVDLVILAGDLTFAEQSTKDLIGPFIREGKEVLIIPGNHESVATTNFLEKMYAGTKNIHGYSFSKGDLGVFGVGGADFGATALTEKQFFDKLNKAHKEIKGKKKKIMVTHMHHEGSEAEFSGFRGSSGIAKAIKELQPDILISGHIHEAEGIEEQIGKTKVINVGRRGRIIEI